MDLVLKLIEWISNNILLSIFIVFVLLKIFGNQNEEPDNTIAQNNKINSQSNKPTNSKNCASYNEWENIRERVFALKGRCCAHCGATVGEIHVHHIIPVSLGGTNDMDNLIPLCKSCHEKVHGRKFRDDGNEMPSAYGESHKESSKLSKIKYAISNDLCLEIKYVKFGGVCSTRKIKPLKVYKGFEDDSHAKEDDIHLKKQCMYLNAYCFKRNQVRIFRISRIKSIEYVN